ncbi:HNH endonuclease domain-containing protein [Polaribacter sp. NJDZ03]|uniref:HNH endonuclease domain-containing protein n=1 Tax=Polaribacter sp. NJDZ03 TaxID=2855841 RepID=UPI001C4A601B|nr:HNH endonuclease domain-containing protein [Polaribacter sp. NJDZ03]
MKRIIKKRASEIVKENLNYIIGNSSNNKKISTILYKEQKGFCAYTEEFIGRTDAKDIEHFNPILKGTDEDSYQNWFLAKHQWNIEKASKWEKYQPILHPTDETFENRILYLNGDYVLADSKDIEAKNLIDLLKLDDILLADERKKYIKRKKVEMEIFGVDSATFFEILINDDLKQVSYLRAIDEEFKIKIWELLPEIE